MVSGLREIANRIAYFGSQRKCTLCNSSVRKFLETGVKRRKNAKCPVCFSLERHRLLVLFFRDKTDLFDGTRKRLLHIAPEACLCRIFSDAVGDGYLTADLFAQDVMEKMDITDIHHPDDSFDVIYCSHVLEHVPDDKQAMKEFCRVLKPAGWAVLNVPITADKTYEDPTITDPEERQKAFGQKDHVRRYGPDYEQRLIDAGFKVKRFSANDLVDEFQMEKFGISPQAAGDIYYCTK